jgi:transcriptional regulator with XRE-family HTH domain
MMELTFKAALFGHDLLRWMQWQKFTLRDAEAATGVDTSTLSRLTRALIVPNLVTFATLCEAMRAPMGDYFEDCQPVVDKGVNDDTN